MVSGMELIWESTDEQNADEYICKEPKMNMILNGCLNPEGRESRLVGLSNIGEILCLEYALCLHMMRSSTWANCYERALLIKAR